MIYLGRKNSASNNNIYPTFVINQVGRETVITNFNAGHGWVKQSAQGTQTDDTTQFMTGSSSLRLTSDGIGSAVFTRRTGLAAINLTNRHLITRMKCPDASRLTEIWIYAFTSGGTSSFFLWKISNDSRMLSRTGEFVKLTLPFSSAELTGTPDRTNITGFQFRIRDNSTQAVNCWLDSISSQANHATGAIVVQTDDGWNDNYNQILPVTNENNIPLTAYIMPDMMGAANYLTLKQIQELQNVHGWEIGGHHQTNMETFSIDEAEARIKTVRDYLRANGLGNNYLHWAWPNGAYNTNLNSRASKYFSTLRSINEFGETIPAADYKALRIFNVLSTTTTAQVATAIANAQAEKALLILLYHKVLASGSPTANTEVSLANFTQNMADVAASTLPKLTLSQALGL